MIGQAYFKTTRWQSLCLHLVPEAKFQDSFQTSEAAEIMMSAGRYFTYLGAGRGEWQWSQALAANALLNMTTDILTLNLSSHLF